MSIWEAALPSLLMAGALSVLLPWSSIRNTPLRRTLVYLTFGLQVRYALWRIYRVVESFEIGTSWFASAAFLFFETVAHLLALRGLWLYASHHTRSKEADAQAGWWLRRGGPPPLIDVFIATYNENRSVLERTIVGAKSMLYPRLRVWVLDDGRREWLAEFAKQKGVQYLTRPSNEHYKAGNLNNAFRHVAALPEPPDYVTVFDADFVARTNFLQRTLALMQGERVAVVQTPQCFYNDDPFQYALRASKVWPDEQRNWFDSRLPSLDAVGGATCCGTSFLLKMQAFRELGAMPTESVSEDTLLSIKLRRLGWQTVYLSEPLSVGLAPEGLVEFLTQRARWCLGGLQIAMNRTWGPRSRKGVLGFLFFLESFLRWSWYASMRVLWAMVPLFFFFFGFSVLRAPWEEVIGFLGPFVISRMAFTWMTRGTVMPIVTDAAPILLCPVLVRVTWNVIFGRAGSAFKVTDKGVSRDRVSVHYRHLALPLALGLLTVGGLVYSCVSPHSPFRSGGMPIIVFIWSYLSLASIYAAIVPCIEPPQRRETERFASLESARVQARDVDHSGTLLDISESGVRLRTSASPTDLEDFSLLVAGVGSVRASVVRRVAADVYGVKLAATDEQHEALIRKLYCSFDYIPFIEQWSFWGSLKAIGLHFLRG